MTVSISSLEAVLAQQLNFKRAIGASLLSPTQKASRYPILSFCLLPFTNDDWIERSFVF